MNQNVPFCLGNYYFLPNGWFDLISFRVLKYFTEKGEKLIISRYIIKSYLDLDHISFNKYSFGLIMSQDNSQPQELTDLSQNWPKELASPGRKKGRSVFHPDSDYTRINDDAPEQTFPKNLPP
jgi:hypothetical protein